MDIPGHKINAAGYYALLVLLSHPADELTSDPRIVIKLVGAERKAAVHLFSWP